jgi:hypothetical protein
VEDLASSITAFPNLRATVSICTEFGRSVCLVQEGCGFIGGGAVVNDS